MLKSLIQRPNDALSIAEEPVTTATVCMQKAYCVGGYVSSRLILCMQPHTVFVPNRKFLART